MSVSYIPEGFQSVTPYFIVDNGSKFLNFLVAAFDAEILGRYDTEDGKLMHSAAKVFGSTVEASEGGGEYPSMSMAIHLYVPDSDAVYEKALAAGGEVIFEIVDKPYGERSGGVKDPCGNHWYIATRTE